MPGRPAWGRALPPRLARPDLSRDIVALPYLLALDSPIDHVPHGLVNVNGVELDPADVAGLRLLGPVHVERIAFDQAIVGSDGNLDPAVARIDPGDLALDDGRVVDARDPLGVGRQVVLANHRGESRHAL